MGQSDTPFSKSESPDVTEQTEAGWHLSTRCNTRYNANCLIEFIHVYFKTIKYLKGSIPKAITKRTVYYVLHNIKLNKTFNSWVNQCAGYAQVRGEGIIQENACMRNRAISIYIFLRLEIEVHICIIQLVSIWPFQSDLFNLTWNPSIAPSPSSLPPSPTVFENVNSFVMSGKYFHMTK